MNNEPSGWVVLVVPTILGRAMQRKLLHLEALPLTVDLQALVNDWTPTYRPLAQWATNTLSEWPGMGWWRSGRRWSRTLRGS